MKTNWKLWLKAALIRAVRTFAEAALAYIGTGAVVLGDVNWLAALSAGAFGFVTAILLAELFYWRILSHMSLFYKLYN